LQQVTCITLVFAFAPEDIISPAGIPKYGMALRTALTFVPGVIAGADFATGLISIVNDPVASCGASGTPHQGYARGHFHPDASWRVFSVSFC